ncbi:MAG: hypothetical protein IJC36_04250 [Clostridia bacterium]|nr:hypothetical protein [Clostridia bacterium]
MDNISEQLVKINKTPKDYFLLGSIWAAAFILVFIFVYLGLNIPTFVSLLFILCVAVMYGAYKLANMLNIEYEYIIVNRDLDIDKIIAKSSRKRLVSVKLNEVSEFGKLSAEKSKKLEARHFDQKFICCNPGSDAYYLTYKHAKKGSILLVLAMNERTKTEALKAIPRTVVSD